MDLPAAVTSSSGYACRTGDAKPTHNTEMAHMTFLNPNKTQTLFISAFSIMVALTIITTRADAQAYDPYPWCAVYGGSMSGSSNCGFRTWQQCMATVSGIGGSCERNQFYNPRASRKQGHTRRSGKPTAPAFVPYGGWSSPSYFYDN